MRRIFKIIAVLLLLLVVAFAALPFLIPAAWLKAQLLAQLEHATGRQVAMEEVHIAFFPDIALKASNVRIGSPGWAGSTDLLTASHLRIGVELLPLLHKHIHVKELALDDSVITLIKQGTQANWQFVPAVSASPTHVAVAVVPTSPIAAPVKTQPLSFDALKLTNTTIILKDSASGTTTVSGINATFKASPFLNDIHFGGSAVYNGQKATITFSATTPLAIMGGTPSDMDVKAAYGDVSLAWKGTFALHSGVPNVTGAATLATLDTQKLPASGKPASAGASTTVTAPAPVSASPAPPSSSSHWSAAPFSFAGLNKANADLTLTIGTLVLPKTTLSNVTAHIVLSGGNLALTTGEIAAYGGSVKLALGVTAPASVTLDTTLTQVRAEGLLHDFAQSDAFAGALSGHIALHASGLSERALVSTLAGSGTILLKDGEFKGKNIASLMRGLNASSLTQTPGEKTVFTQITASFTASQGIITNHDLKMDASTLQATGDGTVDLPNWQVHYTLKPLLVATSAAGGKEASGISVPVRIEGPLDHPSYRADLQAALQENLKDPKLLQQNLKALNKKLINRDTLKQFLGR